MRAKIWPKLRGNLSAGNMSLVLGVFLVAVAIAFSFTPTVAPVPPADAQGVTPNMSGWAWSSNIGWISVNCANSTNGCANGQWGLTLADKVAGKRAINGYAWNDKIGWINFNPTGDYPTPPSTVASPTYLNTADNRLVGWARACNVFISNCTGDLKPDSDRGGWDGWISLGLINSNLTSGDNPYGVIAVPEGNDLKFKYFAWGQTVIGWMNMAPASNVTGVVCMNCVNITPPSVNTLTVNLAGNRSGQVASEPVGIDCSTGSCQADFDENQIVKLTATHDANIGVIWTGCTVDTTDGKICNVTMDQAKTVTAAFDCISNCSTGTTDDILNVDVINEDGGDGQINSSDENISSCKASGGVCRHNYNNNGPSDLVLTAIPVGGSRVIWGGACAMATGNTCTLDVNNSTNVTVTFDGDSCTGTCTNVCTLGDDTCDCQANPTLPGCDNNTCDPDVLNDPDCDTLPQCVSDVVISGQNQTSIDLPTTGGKGSLPALLFNITREAGVTGSIDLTFEADVGQVNSKDTETNDPDQIACFVSGQLVGSVLAPSTLVVGNCSNIDSSQSFISTSKIRYMWLYSPHRGVVGSTISPYVQCNSENSSKGCEVPVKISWSGISDQCVAGDKTLNTYVKYTDLTPTPSQTNPNRNPDSTPGN